jgi:outer membrane lipopolysaccharide assembly protein LptE/RlpB
MNRRALLGGLLLVLLLSGCGYHVPGVGDAWVGQEGRTLYVELFANRTVEPYLDNVVTEEVSIQLSRSRLVELTEQRGMADLVLDGTVTRFDSSVGAYNDADDISEYTASMTVNARLLRRSDGTVLWQDVVSRSETYSAFVDKSLQQEAESGAARVVARRIAEDLYARLLTTF